MPLVPLEQFEEKPEIGETVKVTGKVTAITPQGVDISYDTVEVMEDDNEEQETPEESEDLDTALEKAFPKE